MKLEVLIGMIGSGKSTYARTRADEGAIVVCHDELVAMLHANRGSREMSCGYENGLKGLYREIEESIALSGIYYKRDVIIDRNHLTKESRKRWIDLSFGEDRNLGKNDQIVAVVFPVESPVVHADRRFRSDPRGRSFEEWMEVARHHREQWDKEPFGEDEGFTEIRRLP